MTTYVNKSSEMQTIRFDDGSAAFLRRGQKYTVEGKAITKMGKGIKEVKSTPTPAKSKATSKSADATETESKSQ